MHRIHRTLRIRITVALAMHSMAFGSDSVGSDTKRVRAHIAVKPTHVVFTVYSYVNALRTRCTRAEAEGILQKEQNKAKDRKKVFFHISNEDLERNIPKEVDLYFLESYKDLGVAETTLEEIEAIKARTTTKNFEKVANFLLHEKESKVQQAKEKERPDGMLYQDLVLSEKVLPRPTGDWRDMYTNTRHHYRMFFSPAPLDTLYSIDETALKQEVIRVKQDIQNKKNVPKQKELACQQALHEAEEEMLFWWGKP